MKREPAATYLGFAVFLALFVCVLLAALSGCMIQPEPVQPDPIVDTNRAPFAFVPFTVSDARFGARVDFDLRYRTHGCDNGMAQSVSGAWDPDGDPLEYRATCRWAVYDQAGNKINDLWMTFPRDDNGEQHAIVTLFVGYEDGPPYPFAPKVCDPYVPYVPPDPPGCGVCEDEWFTYAVRDPHGAVASSAALLDVP